MTLIPENNLLAYELIYKIEVGLREFLIDTFGRENSKWWKQRLSPVMIDKMKKGREWEKQIKWVELTPYHPLYYIDFAHLRETIEKGDNWRDAFKGIFGDRDVDKDVFCSGLRELEPVRNKIAHNRKATDNEISLLRSNNSKLESAIGKEKWESLILGQTMELGIYEKLVELGSFSKIVYEKMQRFEPVEDLEFWYKAKEQWWFDTDYLCQDIAPIETLYTIVAEYVSLPRHRGSGYMIESWVKKNISLDLLALSEQAISSLLAQKGI